MSADPDRLAAILTAAEAGDLPEVARLLDADPAAVHATSQAGSVGPHTPLHLAAWQGHRDVARLLLDRGADPDAAGEGGAAPLYYAVKHRHPELVDLLLDRGADPNRADDSGVRPLDLCMAGFDPDDRIIARLELAGARVDLYLALKLVRTETAWQLLRAGDPRPGDPDADLLLNCSTGGMGAAVRIALDRPGAENAHHDPDVRVPVTRRVVDEQLPLFDELLGKGVPITRRSLTALTNAFTLWDPRPADRLLDAGILRPHADRLADRRFRGHLFVSGKLVNQTNPFWPHYEERLRAGGIDLAGLLPGYG